MTTATVVAFLAGLLFGIGVCWGYIRTLRGKIRLFETYIHERLDKQFAVGSEVDDVRSAPDETSAPSSRPETAPSQRTNLR